MIGMVQAQLLTLADPADAAEQRRIAAVEATGLFDTKAEPEFRELAELAAQVCGTPIGLVSLIGSDRQRIKGAVGLELTDLPRRTSFCNTTIALNHMLVVEDATIDERFRHNPHVTRPAGIRFYAGVPLTDPDGEVLGAVCVLDTEPRRLSPAQLKALVTVTGQVRLQLELRRERKQLEQALADKRSIISELRGSEYRFRKFMDHAPFVSFIKDDEGRFVFYNRAMSQRFKISAREWLGKADADLWPKEMAAELRNNDLAVIKGGRLLEKVEETRDAAGQVTCWKTFKFPLKNENGEVWLGGFAVDLTSENEQRRQLQKANQKLERLATTDVLTNLANRRVLDERVEFEFRYALRHKTPLTVVMLDLDDFKKINDTHGHAAGDKVLSQMGKLIAKTLRTTDVGARYGGEEMSILLPGATSDGALLFVARLRKAMAETPWPCGQLTASFGVAELKPTIKTGKRLLELADDAMYDAKRTGKNKVVTEKELLMRTIEALVGERARPKPDSASLLAAASSERTE